MVVQFSLTIQIYVPTPQLYVCCPLIHISFRMYDCVFPY